MEGFVIQWGHDNLVNFLQILTMDTWNYSHEDDTQFIGSIGAYAKPGGDDVAF